MFSKACTYGIKATLFIAKESQKGNRVGLKDIAKQIDSPAAFTAKILQQLKHHQIIYTVKGPLGGFEIEEKKISRIKLKDIVSAIDGDSVYVSCGLGFDHCNEKKPCPIHHQFKLIRNQLKSMLETLSLLDLSDEIENGLTFLKC
jgi:Rrf2 family protein